MEELLIPSFIPHQESRGLIRNDYGKDSRIFNDVFNRKHSLGDTLNYLNIFRSGGGIHIKKENRGKFTDYCGGKVTEACIQKGKHSSNPTTRKRATFAENARHFKHQFGGKMNYLTILNYDYPKI